MQREREGGSRLSQEAEWFLGSRFCPAIVRRLSGPAQAVLNDGMRRRKYSLLFAAVVGAIGVAEAFAVVVVGQVEWRTAGLVDTGLAVFALLLWTVLLGVALAAWVQHLLGAGVGEAFARLEVTRRTAHIAVLGGAPTIELLGKSLRRQEAPLGELRDSLLACAMAHHPGESAETRARLARAAGVAAGVLRMNTDSLRLIAQLEDWVAAAGERLDEVRERFAELRDSLERLPSPVLAAAADPVSGYGVAARAPAAEDRWESLPEALQERLRGSSPRWRDGGDSELDRN